MCALKVLKEHGLLTDNKVYVIAELGLNHGGNIQAAKKLIDSAAKTGVDAVKFQTYITEKRAPKDSPIFSILKQCELPFCAFRELKNYAQSRNLEFISTPFDDESVDFLEEIGCRIHKIASFDVANLKLLKKIAATKKTMIMATGMSSLEEIKTAFAILKEKTSKIALLHCISAYPTKEEDANLSAISVLKETFDCLIGQSDHTAGIFVPLYAVAAGAQVIEKHYKIDDNMNCVDAPVSITEEQMKKMVGQIRKLENIFGDGQLGIRESEQSCKIFRRLSGIK